MKIAILILPICVVGFICLSCGKQTPAPRKLTDAQTKEIYRAYITDYEQHPEQWQHDLLPIAMGYAYEKNFPKAEAIYKQLVAKKPKNTQAIRGLATCYWSNGKLD